MYLICGHLVSVQYQKQIFFNIIKPRTVCLVDIHHSECGYISYINFVLGYPEIG